MRLCDGKSERDQDAERSPRCSGRECEYACDQEEGCRDDAYRGSAHSLDESADEVGKAEAVCHGLQGPCERQYEYRRYHRFHSLRDAAHALIECDGASACVVDDYDDQRHESSHRESDRCVGIRECRNEVCSAEESACVYHSEHACDDEDDYWEYEVEYDALVASFFCSVSVCRVVIDDREEVSVLDSILLELGHLQIVELHEDDREDHDEREDRVEVVRDALDEQVDTVLAFTGEARYCCRP